MTHSRSCFRKLSFQIREFGPACHQRADVIHVDGIAVTAGNDLAAIEEGKAVANKPSVQIIVGDEDNCQITSIPHPLDRPQHFKLLLLPQRRSRFIKD